MCCSGVKAQDVIYTMSGNTIEAEVEVIGTEAVTYQRYQDSTGVKREIALPKVYMIRYEGGKEEILVSERPQPASTAQDSGTKTASSDTAADRDPMVDGQPIKTLTEQEKCARGRADANQYHGKLGRHVLYGVLLGPLATIGAALSDPTPVKGKSTVIQSSNKALFDDPAYRSCYMKEARANNVVGTLIIPLVATGIFLFGSG